LKDYEKVLSQIDSKLMPVTPTVGINLSDKLGITWSDLRAGYNRVSGLRQVPELYACPEMYDHRNADWWNKRTPTGVDSHMTTAPFFGAVATQKLGQGKSWRAQQQLLAKEISYTTATATEAQTPADWPMQDAIALVSNGEQPRPDFYPDFTRFVQYDRDVTGLGDDYGPGAYVYGVGARLDGAFGRTDAGGGFRLVMGPRQLPLVEIQG
jgi:hypothetical protein